MRSTARALLLLIVCGGVSAGLGARPSARPPRPANRPNVDDPAVKYTPPPPPGTTGSSPGAAVGPINSQPDWTYEATYKKSAKLFSIGCYDKSGIPQAFVEISNLAPTSSLGILAKGARPYVKAGGVRLPGGNFSFRGPAPRAGARYRFSTSNDGPKQRNWNIAGDADLRILP